MKPIMYLLILLSILISPVSSAEEPLGIAHNNPGNLTDNALFTWKGQVECKDNRTEPDGNKNICFLSWKWGVRAMMINLRSYQIKHNITTLRQLTSRWATQHTRAYAEFLAAKLAMEPDDPFQLDGNPIFMTFLVVAMIEWEQGYVPYDFDEIYEIAVFGDWVAE